MLVPGASVISTSFSASVADAVVLVPEAVAGVGSALLAGSAVLLVSTLLPFLPLFLY